MAARRICFWILPGAWRTRMLPHAQLEAEKEGRKCLALRSGRRQHFRVRRRQAEVERRGSMQCKHTHTHTHTEISSLKRMPQALQGAPASPPVFWNLPAWICLGLHYLCKIRCNQTRSIPGGAFAVAAAAAAAGDPGRSHPHVLNGFGSGRHQRMLFLLVCP